jgi:hypothetical protein
VKVKVSFTLDIDLVAWTLNYGVEGVPEIRKDVQSYVENGVLAEMRDLGLLVTT